MFKLLKADRLTKNAKSLRAWGGDKGYTHTVCTVPVCSHTWESYRHSLVQLIYTQVALSCHAL